MRKFFFLFCIFFSISHADFLALDIVEKEEPPPNFVYGAHYAGRIFADGIDNFGGASARYRINKNFALGAKTEFNFTRTGFLADAFLHYLLSENLHKELAESYLHIGTGYVRIDEEHSPIFSFGYGRDMLPWKKSPFGFRGLFRLEVAPANNVLSRKNDGLFGFEIIRLSNLAFALEFGMFFY